MGGINRLNSVLKKSDPTRFKILYGSGIDDVFINEKSVELLFDQALYESLIEIGFERVLLFSPHRSLFVYDTKSLPEHNFVNQPFLESGPLNQYQAFKQGIAQASTLPMMGDFHALKIMDTYMRDENQGQTAIILLQAETSILFFEDKRSLASILGEWNNLPTSNTNCCFLVFSVEKYEGLKQISSTLPLPEIRRLISLDQDGLTEVSTPGEDEISRYLALFFEHVDQDKRVTQFLSNENKTLRWWKEKFFLGSKVVQDINLSKASELGWFRAVQNPEENALTRLDSMVGLVAIKKWIHEYIAWAEIRLRKHNSKNYSPLMHLIFSGNPGTGKTTVARLMGEIFHELGWLKRGHLVEVQASDLVESFVGGTAVKTKKIIDQALDGVLFIDEAYGLIEDERGGYGKEALEVLLSRMESDRSRLMVICAGYIEKMDKFRRANPGLARRFPKENCLVFTDYQADELREILQSMLLEREIFIEPDLDTHLDQIITEMVRKKDKDFGNAGEIRNFADSLEKRHALRIVNENLPASSPLASSDISDYYQTFLPVIRSQVELQAWELEFAGLVGLAKIKAEFISLKTRLEYEKLRFDAGISGAGKPHLRHFIFMGNPGTGKTTIARLVGGLLRQLGLLSSGHIVEVSRADLVAGYVGQTALKTRDAILRAIDGILFIDEAYSLAGDHADFGSEAIEEIVKLMEDYRDRFVIVAAGYKHEMLDFLNSNPGLASRFGDPLIFDDFSMDELWDIMHQFMIKEHYNFDNPLKEKVYSYLEWQKLKDKDHFGNARSVRELFEKIKTAAAYRIVEYKRNLDRGLTVEELSNLTEADVPDPGFYLEVGPLATTDAMAKSRL
jgi:SpoVK/Ycf46/Vps4 family AAA+-type ATPase